MRVPSTTSLLLSVLSVLLMGTAKSSGAPVQEEANAPVAQDIQYGLIMPRRITRGVPFKITYRNEPSLAGPHYVYASYGLDKISAARYPSLGLPAFVHSNGDFDTGIPVAKRLKGGEFFHMLTVPTSEESSLGEYLDGEAVFSMALYGTIGGRMDPIVTHFNQTVILRSPQ